MGDHSSIHDLPTLINIKSTPRQVEMPLKSLSGLSRCWNWSLRDSISLEITTWNSLYQVQLKISPKDKRALFYWKQWLYLCYQMRKISSNEIILSQKNGRKLNWIKDHKGPVIGFDREKSSRLAVFAKTVTWVWEMRLSWWNKQDIHIINGMSDHWWDELMPKAKTLVLAQLVQIENKKIIVKNLTYCWDPQFELDVIVIVLEGFARKTMTFKLFNQPDESMFIDSADQISEFKNNHVQIKDHPK